MGKLLFLRGGAAGVAAYTPEDGEPVWDQFNKIPAVGDGATVGGIKIVTTEGTQTLKNKSVYQLKMDDNGGAGAQEILDKNGKTALRFFSVASAVNYLQFNNQATGSHPALLSAGADTHIDLQLRPKNSGKVYAGPGGSTMAVNDQQTANPTLGASGGVLVDGQKVYRTDLAEWFVYDSARNKWLSESLIVYAFGHSSNGISAGAQLRSIGLGSDANSVYYLPYATTIVGYTYARADSDASSFDVMVNAATTVFTINSSATRGVDMSSAISYDLAAGDDLWARVDDSASNAMDPRTLLLYTRRKAT